MTGVVRTGVSFPKELLERFDELVKELNLGSRSSGIHEAIRTFISMNMHKLKGDESIAGTILVHYCHELGDIERNLTEVQHDFLDVIPSTLHIHLTEEDCLLIIAVKGPASRIRKLAEVIRGAGKLKLVLPVLLPIY